MGSTGLCAQTQVGLENPRLRWKDCIVCFLFFAFSSTSAFLVKKGILWGLAGFLMDCLMSIYVTTFSVWMLYDLKSGFICVVREFCFLLDGKPYIKLGWLHFEGSSFSMSFLLSFPKTFWWVMLMNGFQGNIFISEAGVPQIGDFGMSRMIAASQSSLWQTSAEHIKGTVRWLAVEYLKPGKLQSIHTKETDVWAFGVTIYVSGRAHLINSCFQRKDS